MDRFDHPAKTLTRSTNDPKGGPQTSPKGGKAPRNFEQGNPAKCKPSAA